VYNLPRTAPVHVFCINPGAAVVMAGLDPAIHVFGRRSRIALGFASLVRDFA
jgi:hypothetical protein